MLIWKYCHDTLHTYPTTDLSLLIFDNKNEQWVSYDLLSSFLSFLCSFLRLSYATMRNINDGVSLISRFGILLSSQRVYFVILFLSRSNKISLSLSKIQSFFFFFFFSNFFSKQTRQFLLAFQFTFAHNLPFRIFINIIRFTARSPAFKSS